MTTGTFSALLLVVAGAVIAFLSNYLIEWRKERSTMTHRWDESLRLLCSDFVGTARELIFLSRQLSRNTDENVYRQLDEAHLRLRALTHQIRLLGNREVQFAAQLALYHAYAVRMVIGEGKPDDRGGVYEEPPGERYNAALLRFYKSVRKQLKVEDPEDIPPFDIPLGERGLKPYEETELRTMTKALIIGGGIAGPATAIALRKAGIVAGVYESYPADASDDAGTFLTIAANGQDALQAIDVLEPVLDASFPARELRLFDPAGTKLADVTLGRDHPCPQTISRASLSRILRAEAIRRGIPLAYGKRLTGVTSRDRQVAAFFADGSTAEADLLIGADGIHSLVRPLIDPTAPAPRYVGLTIACGYADHVQADGDLDGYQMIYGNRGFFGYTSAPDGRTWWFARVPGPELTATVLSTPADHADHWRKTLADAFAEDNSPAADIINSTPDRITITSAYDIPTLRAWHNDSMIVIGDAAHAASPSTAQGASMAVEDAVILAQCLRDHPEMADALRAFENLRRERVERVVQSGASATNPKPPTPGSRQPSSADWLFKHHIDWDTPDRG